MRGRRRAWLLVALAGLVAVLGSACQVTVAVGVDAHADGSGLVTVTATLDKDAAAQAGTLALDDLRAAGWTVSDPQTQADGSETIRATKPFSTPAGLTAVMAEVSGPTGPFHDFHLTRHRSALATKTSFTGTVDLTGGLGAFADNDLRSALGTGGVGLDPAAVKQATGVDLDRIFKFQVAVRLPGSLVSSNAPTEAGNGAAWQPVLGEKVTLVARSRQQHETTLILLVVAAVAALALIVLLVVRVVRGRRPPTPT